MVRDLPERVSHFGIALHFRLLNRSADLIRLGTTLRPELVFRQYLVEIPLVAMHDISFFVLNDDWLRGASLGGSTFGLNVFI